MLEVNVEEERGVIWRWLLLICEERAASELWRARPVGFVSCPCRGAFLTRP